MKSAAQFFSLFIILVKIKLILPVLQHKILFSVIEVYLKCHKMHTQTNTKAKHNT